MNFKGQDILSTDQFDKKSLIDLFEEAVKMEKIFESGSFSDILAGKIMASIFFESSTRTRFSFETAMIRLGGAVVHNSDMLRTSSITKNETLYDTGKVLSQMVDVVVARHPENGTLAQIAEGSDVPVINAGEGSASHPTQGLLDLYTIYKEFGKIDGLTIGLVGDLKYSRVQHSQIELLKNFDVRFRLVSPAELKLPGEFLDTLNESNIEYIETEDLSKFVEDFDVLSCSRLQNERFENPEDCEKYRGSFVIDKKVLAKCKDQMIVIAPLPRREELPVEIDKDKRVRYFDQVKNGVAVRMALLKKVLIG